MKKWTVALVTLALLTLVAGTASAKAVGTIIYSSRNPIKSPAIVYYAE